MLIRHPVRPKATKFFGPSRGEATVQIVAMSRTEANKTATMCWISHDEKDCTPGNGYPLEPGTKIDIDMSSGEELWAVTQDQSLLAVIVNGPRWK